MRLEGDGDLNNLIGETLGQYTIIEPIGQGAMASVYRATQKSIGREVAIKVLSTELLAQDEVFLERFYGEVQVAANL